MAADSANNSYLLEVDGTSCYIVGDTIISTSNWTWVDYQDGNTSSKIELNLTAGGHVFKAIKREDNVKLDKLILASDTSCIPVGFGNNCSDVPSSTIGLDPGKVLDVGQSITQPDGNLTLKLQSDGNLVLYKNNKAIWTANTYGSGATQLIMQLDGNLVLYDGSRRPIWYTRTWGQPNSKLVLQANGNLVVYSSSNAPLWATNTEKNDSTLLNGDSISVNQLLRSSNGRYTFVLQGDSNLVLYSTNRAIWASNTYGRSMADKLILQDDGNLVLYDTNGNPLWHAHTYGNGISHLVMQDDGNLVLYNMANQPTWYTHTFGQ